MNPDYFLFAIGIVWAAFASVQDLKTKEISDWLNFSLVFLGLFFRLAVSASQGNAWYFVNGLISFALFFCLSYVFYYGSIFAGGDAKLLMGIGTLIPGVTWYGTVFNGLLFIFVLLFVGVIWSIIALFTPFVPVTWARFSEAFAKHRKAYPLLLAAFVIIAMVSFCILSSGAAVAFSLLAAVAILGYPCLKAVDECMIMEVSPSRLTEGDWILSDIKIKRKVVAKTVHGLSREDIVLLKRAGRKVTIKTGVPFSPAFFFTILLMVFFWVSGQSPFGQVSRFLSP